MFWLFASVVLVLVVLHPGFRKVFGWTAVGVVALMGIGGGVAYLSTRPAQTAEIPAECMKDRTAFFDCGAR